MSKIDGAEGAIVPTTPKKKPITNGEQASGGTKSSTKKRKLNKEESVEGQGGKSAAVDDIQVAKEESKAPNV